MTTSAVSSGVSEDTMPPEGRKALFGAWLGFFVDMFDVYLPVIALAPAGAYFQATDVSPVTATIISGMIFAATLIGRPIGAIIFGHFADRVGRRRTAIVAVTGFGVVTGLIAVLPGYQTLGLAAVILLILLRFVDGVFLGGEYTSATPLALEYSPKRKRGLYGGFIMSGYPLAYCAVALITFGVLAFVPAGDLDSPYVQWGWRIPFAIGALLAFAFVVWFATQVKESPAWEEGTKSSSPLRELFQGQNLRNFLQVFVLMTGIWLSLNMVSAVLPGLLADPVGLGETEVSVVLIISYAVLAIGYLAAGVTSQRIGRRLYLLCTGAVTVFVAPIGYALVVAGVVTGLTGIVLTVIAINLLALSVWGVVTTYINERFRTGIRASGYGLGYSLAVVIPAFYGFYQAGLAQFMPLEYTPLVLLVLAGALIWGGAALGPETRDVDMHQPAEDSPGSSVGADATARSAGEA